MHMKIFSVPFRKCKSLGHLNKTPPRKNNQFASSVCPSLTAEVRETAARGLVKRFHSAGKLAKARPVHEQASRKVHLRVQVLLGGQFPEQLRQGLQGPFDHATPRHVRERRRGGHLRGGHLRGAGRQDLPERRGRGPDRRWVRIFTFFFNLTTLFLSKNK